MSPPEDTVTPPAGRTMVIEVAATLPQWGSVTTSMSWPAAALKAYQSVSAPWSRVPRIRTPAALTASGMAPPMASFGAPVSQKSGATASHSSRPTPTHWPLAQLSLSVHGSPSSQVARSCSETRAHSPLAASQVSTAQVAPGSEHTWSWTSQRSPPATWTHTPAAALQASPSSQGAPGCLFAQAPQRSTSPPQMASVQSSWPVHGSPSLHGIPLARATMAQAPVSASHTPTRQALSRSWQSTEAPTQLPAWHASLTVQRSPSLQGSPEGRAARPQVPVVGSQRPSRHAVSRLVQSRSTGVPTQKPFSQRSALVQRSPSSQLAPAAASQHAASQVRAVPAQTPLAQRSLIVAPSPSLQGEPSGEKTAPPQMPARQLSPTLQASWSSQLEPSLRGWATQAPASQTPTAQVAARSLQSMAVPRQMCPSQVSPTVHGSPSSQLSPLTSPAQPTAVAPPSPPMASGAWHTSSPTQLPARHSSSTVQATPSSHTVPLATGRPTHTLSPQRSLIVHESPSSQADPSATPWQKSSWMLRTSLRQPAARASMAKAPVRITARAERRANI